MASRSCRMVRFPGISPVVLPWVSPKPPVGGWIWEGKHKSRPHLTFIKGAAIIRLMTPTTFISRQIPEPHTPGGEILTAFTREGGENKLLIGQSPRGECPIEVATFKEGELPTNGTLIILDPEWLPPDQVHASRFLPIVVLVDDSQDISGKNPNTAAWLRLADLLLCGSLDRRSELESHFGFPLGFKTIQLPATIDRVGMEGIREGRWREEGLEAFKIELGRKVVVLEANSSASEVEAARFVAWKLGQALPEADLLIAGHAGGWLARDPLPANVKCLGWLDFEARRRLLALTDMAVMPYSIPPPDKVVCLVEYLLAGIPVLATRKTLHEELADKGVAQLAELDGFTDAARQHLDDEKKRKSLAENGRTMAMEIASPSRRYRELMEAIVFRKKRRVLILNDYQVTPAEQGGQVRVDAVCRALADRRIPVTLITMSDKPGGRRRIINSHFEELTLPRGEKLKKLDDRFSKMAGANASDVATLKGAARFSPGAADFLRRELTGAALVMFSHPYMAGFLDVVPDDVPVVYDSHNTEWKLKRSIYPRLLGREYLSRLVRGAEGRLLKRARTTYYVSSENRQDLAPLTGGKEGSSFVCPNGVSTKGREWIDPADRATRRGEVSLTGNLVALFLGSGHPPNAEAARYIIGTLAPAFPRVNFFLIGSVTGWFHGKQLPSNVVAMGRTSAPVKDSLLSLADIALNPMMTGSGTSLKMMDYMASGLPILSTDIGARGMEGDQLKGTTVVPLEKFHDGLAELIENQDHRHSLARQARETAIHHFDWNITLREMVEDIGLMYDQNRD